MNCANHPETPVSAYCQSCGKPLCEQCVRSVQGLIYCESCLAARLGVPAAGVASTAASPVTGSPNPVTAAVLGFIPGVGAMYNGQFAKALVHVVVFALLIGLSNHNGIFGIFIAAWVAYQVFDAAHTARARRDGLPLPDPFGLNDLGNRMGMRGAPAAAPFAPYVAPPSPYASAYGEPPAAAQATPGVPIPPMTPPVPPARSEPIGAIVLIVVGMLFLFSTLGIFRFDWIGEGWPVIVIVVGVWLLVRRTRSVPPPVGGA
ncbi:MAG: hypothetical protein HIU93_09475 [Acidobacteria bacterium]|nr:hypothetical protein [Acidobacteriota bacterium]MBW4045405.1 hypothetical protein [Acidobacteriota bacterium]